MTTAGAVILASYRWPAGDDLSAVRQSLSDALPGGSSIVEAREREDAAIGAAALVNAAARDLNQGRLVVARPDCQWCSSPLRDALEALTDEVVLLEMADEAEASLHACPGRSPWTWPPTASTTPDALIVPASRFHDLGGLDEALWSIGELEDFAARASVVGATVIRLVVPGRRLAVVPFPLPAPTRQFLSIRNRLRTAFKTLTPDRLGPELALTAASAVAASSAAAAFDRERLEHGRNWPRSDRRPSSVSTTSDVWPRDEVGTLVPLLALDSFAAESSSLLPVREDLQRRRANPDAPCGPDAGPPHTLLDAIADAGAPWPRTSA